MEPIRVVIPAGGSSSRMGGVNKLTAMLGDYPVIIHTLKAFHSLKYINQIIIVIPQDEECVYTRLLSEYNLINKIKFAYSGLSRRESVYNGLMALDDHEGIVLIHDGARPLVSRQIIDECIEGAKRYGVCLAASKNTDTVKMADNIMFVEKTIEREKIYNAQTPQAFKTEFAILLHEMAERDELDVTDDSSIAEHYGHNVKIIESDASNIKITTKKDLSIAEVLLSYCD